MIFINWLMLMDLICNLMRYVNKDRTFLLLMTLVYLYFTLFLQLYDLDKFIT